jgi:hypothetical protein
MGAEQTSRRRAFYIRAPTETVHLAAVIPLPKSGEDDAKKQGALVRQQAEIYVR